MSYKTMWNALKTKLTKMVNGNWPQLGQALKELRNIERGNVEPIRMPAKRTAKKTPKLNRKELQRRKDEAEIEFQRMKKKNEEQELYSLEHMDDKDEKDDEDG